MFLKRVFNPFQNFFIYKFVTNIFSEQVFMHRTFVILGDCLNNNFSYSIRPQVKFRCVYVHLLPDSSFVSLLAHFTLCCDRTLYFFYYCYRPVSVSVYLSILYTFRQFLCFLDLFLDSCLFWLLPSVEPTLKSVVFFLCFPSFYVPTRFEN